MTKDAILLNYFKGYFPVCLILLFNFWHLVFLVNTTESNSKSFGNTNVTEQERLKSIMTTIVESNNAPNTYNISRNNDTHSFMEGEQFSFKDPNPDIKENQEASNKPSLSELLDVASSYSHSTFAEGTERINAETDQIDEFVFKILFDDKEFLMDKRNETFWINEEVKKEPIIRMKEKSEIISKTNEGTHNPEETIEENVSSVSFYEPLTVLEEKENKSVKKKIMDLETSEISNSFNNSISIDELFLDMESLVEDVLANMQFDTIGDTLHESDLNGLNIDELLTTSFAQENMEPFLEQPYFSFEENSSYEFKMKTQGKSKKKEGNTILTENSIKSTNCVVAKKIKHNESDIQDTTIDAQSQNNREYKLLNKKRKINMEHHCLPIETNNKKMKRKNKKKKDVDNFAESCTLLSKIDCSKILLEHSYFLRLESLLKEMKNIIFKTNLQNNAELYNVIELISYSLKCPYDEVKKNIRPLSKQAKQCFHDLFNFLREYNTYFTSFGICQCTFNILKSGDFLKLYCSLLSLVINDVLHMEKYRIRRILDTKKNELEEIIKRNGDSNDENVLSVFECDQFFIRLPSYRFVQTCKILRELLFTKRDYIYVNGAQRYSVISLLSEFINRFKQNFISLHKGFTIIKQTKDMDHFRKIYFTEKKKANKNLNSFITTVVTVQKELKKSLHSLCPNEADLANILYYKFSELILKRFMIPYENMDQLTLLVKTFQKFIHLFEKDIFGKRSLEKYEFLPNNSSFVVTQNEKEIMEACLFFSELEIYRIISLQIRHVVDKALSWIELYLEDKELTRSIMRKVGDVLLANRNLWRLTDLLLNTIYIISKNKKVAKTLMHVEHKSRMLNNYIEELRLILERMEKGLERKNNSPKPQELFQIIYKMYNNMLASIKEIV